jgi:hypothetical protein
MKNNSKNQKFWCETCRIFVEYNGRSIETHNKSKKHQAIIGRDQAYKIQKQKLQKHTDYLKGESSELLGKKRSEGTNNIFLDEIKREILQEDIKTKYNKYIKKKKEKVWGVFMDQSSDQPYYYNFVTKDSQWERPADYDGPELEGKKPVANTEKDKKGIVGTWETVETGSSVFGKKSTTEHLLPGQLKTGEHIVVEDEYEEVIQVKERPRRNEMTIDRYIDDENDQGEVGLNKYGPQCISQSYNADEDDNNDELEFNLDKEELVEVNEKLKKYDKNSVLYVNPIKDIDEVKLTDANTVIDKVDFNFKPVVKKPKKPVII